MSEKYLDYPEDLEQTLPDEPQLSDIFTAPERTIQAAHDNYPKQATPKVARRPQPESRNGAVVTRTPDPLLWKSILKDLIETGKDPRHLIYNEDGSIVIAKHPQR